MSNCRRRKYLQHFTRRRDKHLRTMAIICCDVTKSESTVAVNHKDIYVSFQCSTFCNIKCLRRNNRIVTVVNYLNTIDVSLGKKMAGFPRVACQWLTQGFFFFVLHLLLPLHLNCPIRGQESLPQSTLDV